MNHEPRVAILGAGAWGSALAIHLAKQGRNVALWGRNLEQISDMEQSRVNARYLPRQDLPKSIFLTANVAEAISGAAEVICMMPSKTFMEFLDLVAPHVNQEHIIMWGCKGLAQSDVSLFFHELVREKLGEKTKVVALSGPSFAQELANGMPTAVVLASDDRAVLERVLPRIHGGSLRCYLSQNLKEVQLCGTYKNIIAVAAGISDGLGLGANARSALITRGLAEVMRMAEAMQFYSQTFVGLAGLGDIILSSTSDLSRNRRLGLNLGKGLSLSEAKQAMGMHTVESLSNVGILLKLAQSHEIELPIAEQVRDVLAEDVSPGDALKLLLARGPKAEA